jgi:hypothetical protein
MKNIKAKLTTWIGLFAVCLLPVGTRAGQHFQSGIIGLLESPGSYNLIEVSDGKNSIAVQMDRDGFFEVDLKPGRYVLTPYLIPVVGPGQAYPNIVVTGPSMRVRVTEHHFTFVEIPVQRLLPPPPNGYQPFHIGG